MYVWLEKVLIGERVEKMLKVGVVMGGETKSLEDSLEDEDMARNTKHASVVVTVLLCRLIQEVDE